LNLLLLRYDDFLRQSSQCGILTVQQESLRHIDSALMMRNHHCGKIVVRIASHRRG